MLRSMSSRQFEEWRIFFQLELSESEKMDYRFASIVQTLANSNRDRKKRANPYELKECVLLFGDSPRVEPRRRDWREMKAMAKSISREHNAREERKRGRKRR